MTIRHHRSRTRFARFLRTTVLGLALGALLIHVPSTRGAVGDIAIYREAGGADAIAQGVMITHDWDTTVRSVPSTYTLAAGGTNIQCTSGHYLVLYGARFDDPTQGAGDRSEVNSRLQLAGVEQPIGWSQGYVRRQNNTDYECVTAGGGIIVVQSDGDVVRLLSERTDAEPNDLQREPNGSDIQFVKLDSGWDYCRLSRMSNAGGPGTAFTVVTYDTQDELDTDSFGHTGGDITLKTAGHYMVLANTHIRGTHASRRCGYVQRLTLDGAQVDGSLTTVYVRGDPNSDNCYDGAASAAMIIETASDNQVLNVECMKEDVTAGANIIGGRTAITIVKLPDSGEYIRLDDSGTDDFNPANLTALGWDVEEEIDSCFTHADSQIGVTLDDDYLFFCTLYCDDDGGARVKWWQRWRKNGNSIFPYGATARYSRDNTDNSGTNHKSGNRSAIVVDLVNGDYIETVCSRLAQGGTMSADIKGVQGVRLSSILVSRPDGAPLAMNGQDGATGILNRSATLGGELVSTGTSATTLWVYYGTNDAGDSATNWEANAMFGTDMAKGAYSTNVTGLLPNTTYYYRFAASNAVGNVWAPGVVVFKTLGPPTVTHDGGADTRIAAVSLQGELTEGTSADATVYWGRTDGGTNAAAWENTNALGQLSEGWFAVGRSWAETLTGVDITNQSPGQAGSESRLYDAWTVTGSGDDIWNTNDHCRFAYTQLTGDFDVYCRASDFTGGTDAWRKGGLMARESLAGTGMNAFIGRSPVSGQNRITFQYRVTNTAASVSTHQNGFTDSHYWLRLIRAGDTFSGYWAPDTGGAPGVWSQMGTDQTIDMNGQIYVGLAVTAHNDNQLTTCTFDRLGGLTSKLDEFLYGIEHRYRVYATNTYGADWSDATESFHTEPPAAVGISADTVTDLTTNSATLNGTFNGTGSVFDVSVYWGTSDGGAAPGA